MNKLSWKPVTLEECMKALGQLLTPKEEKELVESSKSKLIVYHHGLGRWIRNNWGLWEKGDLYHNLSAMGFIHPDDMSQSLIEEYWERKNGLPSTLQDKIKKYAEYWENKNE